MAKSPPHVSSTSRKLWGLIALLSVAVPTVIAQAPNEAHMQKMMEQAQKMQACLAEVDQGSIEALRAESEQLAQKVSALCDAGKRDEAQGQIVAYSKKAAASPELEEMRKCGELMTGMLPDLKIPHTQDLTGNTHVCDMR